MRLAVRHISSFRNDEAGGVAVLSALSLVMIVGVAGLVLDGTLLYLQKRKLQNATDLASISAAANPAQAQTAAAATLTRNGFSGSVIANLEYGTYSADPSTDSTLRFVPQASAGNAVRLTTQIQASSLFGRVMAMNSAIAANSPVTSMQTNTIRIGARAVAMQTNRAAFAIGTRLAGLDGGIANALLGAMLGANLSLSLMDYQALASVNIDLFEFSGALATRLHMTGASYDQVLGTSAQLPTIFGAMADTTHGNVQAQAALQVLASALGTSAIALSPIMSLGTYGSQTASTSGPLVASATALDLLSAVAQVSNGTRQVQVDFGAAIPGLAGASLKLGIGERPVGSGLVAVGGVGATLHTAQTRLQFTLKVGPVAGTYITLPLYIELASGTAVLSAVTCNPLTPANVSVTLGVTPAVVDAEVGTISPTAFSNFSQAPTVTPATLLSLLGLVSVTGQAHAAMTNNAPTLVSYSAAEIAAATRKTASTTQYTSSLTSSLVGNLVLQAQVVGLGIGVPANLTQTVGQALGNATAPVDQLLAGVLAALGIGLGQADTWVTGARCGGAVLVN
jgi:uncharacterized membrane protein